MSSPDQDRQRNREIAENEANRQVVGDVRVSVWAIAVCDHCRPDCVRHRLGMAQPLKIPSDGGFRRPAALRAVSIEVEALSTSLRAKRSNPRSSTEGMDCFVASLLAMTMAPLLYAGWLATS
jgi:hypothetical protein